MKKFDLIIFDLDGTLFDTKDSIISSVCLAAKNLGYNDLSEEDKKVFLGPPLDYSVPIVFKTNEEDTKRIIEEYRRVYFETEMYKTKLYDGILDLLKNLKNNNYKIALSTYKSQNCLKNILKSLEIRQLDNHTNGLDCQFFLGKLAVYIGRTDSSPYLNNHELLSLTKG